MKSVALIALSLFAANAMAEVAQQKCTLAFNQGPFTSFTISYHVDAKKDLLDGEVVLKGRVNEKFDDVQGLDESMKWESTFDINAAEKWAHEIVFEPRENGDYNSASIRFETDDNGLYAMMKYASDGPAVFSIYRCSDFPFNSAYARANN